MLPALKHVLSRLIGWVKVNKFNYKVFSVIISKSSGKGQRQPPEVFYEKKMF